MRERFPGRLFGWAPCVAALCACASYDGASLKPGQSTLQQVRATMGRPALEWTDPDGSVQLSYPRGPAGFDSYMVYLDPKGRLSRIEDVMAAASFQRIATGMSEQDVLRILGPPVPAWTAYYPARNERVWEWRYCDELGQIGRFDVLFNAQLHTVRTSLGRPEPCESDPCLCGPAR